MTKKKDYRELFKSGSLIVLTMGLSGKSNWNFIFNFRPNPLILKISINSFLRIFFLFVKIIQVYIFLRNSARNSVVQNSVGPISDFPDIEEEPPDSHKTLEDPDPNDLELDPGSPRIEYNYKNSPLPITARD